MFFFSVLVKTFSFFMSKFTGIDFKHYGQP